MSVERVCTIPYVRFLQKYNMYGTVQSNKKVSNTFRDKTDVPYGHGTSTVPYYTSSTFYKKIVKHDYFRRLNHLTPNLQKIQFLMSRKLASYFD